MKRDVVIATVVGFILGGIFALLITNLPNLIKEGVPGTGRKIETITPSPPTKIITDTTNLEIQVPLDQSLSTNKTIDVVGKAKPGVLILIENDLDSKILEASSSGSFKNGLTLSDGRNVIYISAYDENGGSVTQKLTVYYTSEKL